jgi:hypothetical protein
MPLTTVMLVMLCSSATSQVKQPATIQGKVLSVLPGSEDEQQTGVVLIEVEVELKNGKSARLQITKQTKMEKATRNGRTAARHTDIMVGRWVEIMAPNIVQLSSPPLYPNLPEILILQDKR